MTASLEKRADVSGHGSEGDTPTFVECVECGRADLPVQYAYQLKDGSYLCYFDFKSVCVGQYLNRVDDGEA